MEALAASGEKTASAANAFIRQAREKLAEQSRANMVLLRGFSQLPSFPSMGESYKLNPAAVAAYPMYRGLARVVGMKVIQTGQSFEDELDALGERYEDHDFFYLALQASRCRRGRRRL